MNQKNNTDEDEEYEKKDVQVKDKIWPTINIILKETDRKWNRIETVEDTPYERHAMEQDEHIRWIMTYGEVDQG